MDRDQNLPLCSWIFSFVHKCYIGSISEQKLSGEKIKDSAVFWSIQLLTTLDLLNVSQEGLLHKPKSRTMCGEFFVHAHGQHS